MKTILKLKLTKATSLLTLAIIFATSCSKKQPNSETTDFCSSIHRNDSISLTESLAGLEDSMKQKTGVYVLEDGGYAMITRAWLSEYAEKNQ